LRVDVLVIVNLPVRSVLELLFLLALLHAG